MDLLALLAQPPCGVLGARVVDFEHHALDVHRFEGALETTRELDPWMQGAVLVEHQISFP